MISDKIKQIRLAQKKLKSVQDKKELMIYELDKKRKEDEEKFVKPLILEQQGFKKEIIDLRNEISQILCDKVKELSLDTESDAEISELIECLRVVVELYDYSIPNDLKSKFKPLLKYLFKTEDVVNIDKYLRYICGNVGDDLFKDIINKDGLLERYINEYITEIVSF